MTSQNPAKHNYSAARQWQFLPLLRKQLHKNILFTVFILMAGVAGYFIALLQKPVYISHLTFSIDEEGISHEIEGLSSRNGQYQLSLGTAESIFSHDNISEIMISRRIVEECLLSDCEINGKRYKFIEYYLAGSGLRKSVFSGRTLYNTTFEIGLDKNKLTPAQDKVLFMIYNDLTSGRLSVLKPNKRLSIYKVQLRCFDEVFAREFTGKLLEKTNEYYREICTRKTRGMIELLETRLEYMRVNYHRTLNRNARIQDENINLALQDPRTPFQKEQINTIIYEKNLQEMNKNLELARFIYLKNIPLLQIIDYTKYPLEKQKTSSLKTVLVFMYSTVVLLLLFPGLFARLKEQTEMSVSGHSA